MGSQNGHQVELSRLGLLPAHFGEHALADEDAAGDGQGLPGAAEARLDEGDPPCVRLAVHCETAVKGCLQGKKFLKEGCLRPVFNNMSLSPGRVTRCIFEKVAQNVAKSIFCSNLFRFF
jgi:hypothetical protein